MVAPFPILERQTRASSNSSSEILALATRISALAVRVDPYELAQNYPTLRLRNIGSRAHDLTNQPSSVTRDCPDCRPMLELGT
jgi:hypothetical protein